jgi:hypothetical protein
MNKTAQPLILLLLCAVGMCVGALHSTHAPAPPPAKTGFQRELGQGVAPYKAKAKNLTKEIRLLEDELRQAGLSIESKCKAEDAIKARRRDLEDLSSDVYKIFGKRQEECMAAIARDLEASIDELFKAKRFSAVVKYGEAEVYCRPPQKSPCMVLDNPPEVPDGVDVTDRVIEIANGSWEESR